MITAITGATSGIGFAAATLLAARGEIVVMACRNAEKAEQKRNEIAQSLHFDKSTAKERLPFVEIDLSSIESCLRAAKALEQLKIDRLYSNGASMFSDWGLSKDGYERSLATNCIGPAVLCHALSECTTLKTIVHTVSISCKVAKIDQNLFSSSAQPKYSRLKNYSASKLALFLYISKLCTRAPALPRIVAIDPGIVNTGMITQERWFDPLADIFFRPFIRKPETAAQIGIRALDDAQNHKLYQGRKTYDFPQAIQNHPLRDWVWDKLSNIFETIPTTTDFRQL